MSKYLSFDNESDKFRFVEICADRKDGFITGAIPAKRDIRNSIHALFFLMIRYSPQHSAQKL